MGFSIQITRGSGDLFFGGPMTEKMHCDGAHICLVGANRFQNEMFVEILKQNHQCQNTFSLAASLPEIPENFLNKAHPKTIFYLDCFGLDEQPLKSLLASACQTFQLDNILALFNLVKDTGVEKEALDYGVRGFFYIDDSPNDFCKGTQGLLRGEIWLSRLAASELIMAATQPPSQHLLKESGPAHLSVREKEVLAHLANGASNETIATELFISVHTLRTHLYHIYQKINVHNRMQAVRWWERNL